VRLGFNGKTDQNATFAAANILGVDRVLDLDHCHPLVRAIHNILSTNLADITFAQLIDGLPLVDTVWDMRGSLLIKGHPLIDHDHLCESAMEQVRIFRDTFNPTMLRLDSHVRHPMMWITISKDSDSYQEMQKYQGASPGTRGFNLRLAGLVAASIHQIAVLSFQSDTKVHSKDDIERVVSWKKEPQWEVLERGRRIFEEGLEPRPTLFYHIDYLDYDQYPNGLADAAGYWS
jgi:hypothetical protein